MAGWFPVQEDQLPVLLPDIKDFKPTVDGLSPLQKPLKAGWKPIARNAAGKQKERLMLVIHS